MHNILRKHDEIIQGSMGSGFYQRHSVFNIQGRFIFLSWMFKQELLAILLQNIQSLNIFINLVLIYILKYLIINKFKRVLLIILYNFIDSDLKDILSL